MYELNVELSFDERRCSVSADTTAFSWMCARPRKTSAPKKRASSGFSRPDLEGPERVGRTAPSRWRSAKL